MLSLGRENFQFEACAIVHDSIISAKFLCKTYYWKKKKEKKINYSHYKQISLTSARNDNQT